MVKQSRNSTTSEFSGFAAFASHTSSASAAIARVHEQQQQQQQQQSITNKTNSKPKLKPSPIYTGTDSTLIQIFKRIGQKRDATTKSRALSELISYAFPDTAPATTTATNGNGNGNGNLKKADQITALSHFFFLFSNKLIHDNHSSVRSEAIHVLGCAIQHVPKAFKTLLLHDASTSNATSNSTTTATVTATATGSVGNVIGWVYTSIYSQIREVSRIAQQVWDDIMKELLVLEKPIDASTSTSTSTTSTHSSNDHMNNNMTTTIIQKQMISHVESILQNSSRPTNLATALSVIGKTNNNSNHNYRQEKGNKKKGNTSAAASVAVTDGNSNSISISNGKKMSESDLDEMQERYERVVLLTLNGMNHFITFMPEERNNNDENYDSTCTDSIPIPFTFTYDTQFTNTAAVLWKHLSHANSSFRRATYSLLTSICQHTPSIIHPTSCSSSSTAAAAMAATDTASTVVRKKDHNLSTLIIKILSSEKDPSNFQSLFEMILVYIASFRQYAYTETTNKANVKVKVNAWLSNTDDNANANTNPNSNPNGTSYGLDSKEFTKTLCKTVRRACYGSPPSSSWGSCMLPIIVSLPTMTQQVQVLISLWSGLASALNDADAASIVEAVSECSTYLLLCNNDDDIDGKSNDEEAIHQLSTEIAQAFLESLSYYLNNVSSSSSSNSSGGDGFNSASSVAENKLKLTLTKGMHKLDTLGSTKNNCHFHHIRDWFWKEMIMNELMRTTITNNNGDNDIGDGLMSENVLRQLDQLLIGMKDLSPKQEEKVVHYSNLCPVLYLIFWTKLQPKDKEIPILEEVSLMVCIMNFCGLNTIFADENGALSTSAIDHFCIQTLIHWILFHTSSSSSKEKGWKEELKPVFTMLRMMIESSEHKKLLWESILKDIINVGCDLTKLSFGLKTLVAGMDPEQCNDLFVCEILDSFSAHTAVRLLGNQEDDTGANLFLRTCAGLEYKIPTCLVTSNAIQSWIETCVSKESDLNGPKNGLLEILILFCSQPKCAIDEDDVVKLILSAWIEGAPTWEMKEMDILLKPKTAILSKMVKISSAMLKDEIKSSIFQKENVDLSSFIWSQRAWRLIYLLNKTEGGSGNRLSFTGLDDANLWRSAIESGNLVKSNFLYLSLVYLLQNFATAPDRKRFLTENEHDNMPILILILMTLAKSCNNYADHSQISRCNYVSHLLGDFKKITDEDMKSFISNSLSMLCTVMEDQSCQEEARMGVVVLDWFLGLFVEKYVPSSPLDLPADDINPNEVKNGEEFWYLTDSSKKDSERVKATILKIHTDDFPNLYFSIQMGDITKQTIPSRLKKYPFKPKEKSNAADSTKKHMAWIEESITTKIVKPYFFHNDSFTSEIAAECLNIVISRCGLLGAAGIGSIRYDVFQFLTKNEKESLNQINENDVSILSSNLKKISLALGYGMYTSSSKDNAGILRFDCGDLMEGLLELYERGEHIPLLNESASLNSSMIMWLSVSVKTTLNETNAARIWALASDVISTVVGGGCYNDYKGWLLMLLRLLGPMQKAMTILPVELKAVTIDSDQSIMSNLIKIFVGCDNQAFDSLDVGEYFSDQEYFDVASVEKPSYFKSFNSFVMSHLHSQSASLLYGAHMQVEGLCGNLQSQNKQWCAFQIISSLSKQSNKLYKKDDALSPKTCAKLDQWIKKYEEEEAAEIEEDVLVAGMWMPRYLMNSLESFGEKEIDEYENSDQMLTSSLLKWLLCIDFLDAAAASDMRNRTHIGSYINMTGAVKHVLNLALHHANLENRKEMDWFNSTSIENKKCEFSVADVSTLVLFRSAESIPTLFKSWWSDNCPRSIQPAISKFVEAMVAPETLRRELDRIRVASDLGDLSVNGSCVSREIVATYVQDECKLSVMIRIPPSFPLRNVEVDCQKTLGISEKRWRHWSLQIMLMLNSQDGSILDALMLWKQNVDKEFEGVEACPVCYSVLCVKTHAMPNLECKTCHNRFHSSCLYKWFNSSGKNQCVLCQQPWSGTKVGK